MCKNVLITGASSGIGLATAIFLSHKKYNVFGTTRDLSKLNTGTLIQRYRDDHTTYKILTHNGFSIEKTAEKLPIELPKLKHILEEIKFIQMDVQNDTSVGKAIDKVLEFSHHKIDVLINNAGVGVFGPIEEVPIDQVRQLFETNVMSLLRVVQHIVPVMRENRLGKIINISSLAALMSIPFFSHYSATKAAVERLTEGLRMELKPFDIKVTAIEPGDINTNFNANVVNKTKSLFQLTSQNLSAIIHNMPLRQNSFYYRNAMKCWQTNTLTMLISPSPTIVAKKIYKIIRTKNPAARYKVGSLTQTLPVYLAQKLFSDKMRQWGYEKYYKIE